LEKKEEEEEEGKKKLFGTKFIDSISVHVLTKFLMSRSSSKSITAKEPRDSCKLQTTAC